MAVRGYIDEAKSPLGRREKQGDGAIGQSLAKNTPVHLQKTAMRRVKNNSLAIRRMAKHYLLPANGKVENQSFGKFICTIGLNSISLHPKNQHFKP